MDEENTTGKGWPLQPSIAVTVAGGGTLAQSTLTSAGTPDIICDARLIALMVAGDSMHPGIVLAVPAGFDPQAASVTYLVLI